MDRRYGFTIMSLIRHNVPKTMKMSLHAESERPGGPLPVGGGGRASEGEGERLARWLPCLICTLVLSATRNITA